MKLFYHCFYEREGYFICYKISAMYKGLSSQYLFENKTFVFWIFPLKWKWDLIFFFSIQHMQASVFGGNNWKIVFLIVHIQYTKLDLMSSKGFSNLVNSVIPLQGECFMLLKPLLFFVVLWGCIFTSFL